MTMDPRVDAGAKVKLAAALAYFIAPIDLIPEAFLGPLGFSDDVAVACLALDAVLNSPHHQAVAREHWQGDQELLGVIQRVIGSASNMLGKRVWAQVQSRFGRRK